MVKLQIQEDIWQVNIQTLFFGTLMSQWSWYFLVTKQKSNEVRNKDNLSPRSAWSTRCIETDLCLPEGKGNGIQNVCSLRGRELSWKSLSWSQRKREMNIFYFCTGLGGTEKKKKSPIASSYLGGESEFLLLRWPENFNFQQMDSFKAQRVYRTPR